MTCNSTWFGNNNNNHNSGNQKCWEVEIQIYFSAYRSVSMETIILKGSSRKSEYYKKWKKKKKNQQTHQSNSRHNNAKSTSSRLITHTYCKELNHWKTLKENKQEGVGWDHTGNNSVSVTTKHSSQRLPSSDNMMPALALSHGKCS